MPETTSLASSRRLADPNAPALWHRRLAYLVARKWSVRMESNKTLSEGALEGRLIAIRCAKSKTPPITVSAHVLERVHEVWGVFLTQTDSAEIYSMSAQDFKRIAYFYSPRNGVPLYSARRVRFVRRAQLLGTISEAEVEDIEIP